MAVSYKAPVKEVIFAFDVLDSYNILQKIERFSDFSPEIAVPAIEECAKFAEEVLAPINSVGDTHGATFKDGKVIMPPGFHEAYDKFKKAGWASMSLPYEIGGGGMPYTLSGGTLEILCAANMSFVLGPGLSIGAISGINFNASVAQKDKYLPKLVSGDWTGTMNLSEPQSGSDLNHITTKAELQEDGTYKITGTKIWIGSGEHDLAENIIHLVLAKIPNGPDGVKGISLFIVPKFLVNDDGSLGARNQVSVGKVEKKMGIHGNATCVMNYDGATGYLVGEEHKGMRAMFTMMNEARLGVGLQGLSQAELAYQNALAYAKDRLQGRDVTGSKNPNGLADPIIFHPDVRRNLMDQKCFSEGSRAFILWGANIIDKANQTSDTNADGLIGLLTPVIKGFLTDKGFDMTIQAQQIYGGHGYIEEWGMSQFARDARIAMIYEGANGIQALDLVGRKLPQDQGKNMIAFFTILKTYIKENQKKSEEFDNIFLEPMKSATADLEGAVLYFMEKGIKNPNDALSGSYDFMHLFGYVCLGFMWCKMAEASFEATTSGSHNNDFHQSKISTGQYFMERQLPFTKLHLARIRTGSNVVMKLKPENF